MPKRFTQEEFIKRAAEIHGDKYDYSEAVYVNSNTKVKITCKECGETFNALPNNLLHGHGCPGCYRLKQKKPRITAEEYFKRVRKAHGDRYDYSKAVFTGTHNLITVICPVHGEFQQDAKSHLKCGCFKCFHENNRNAFAEYNKGAQKKAREKFFERLHKDFSFLDTSRLQYIDGKTKVTLGCPKHGYFKIWPRDITRARGNASGCPECKKENFMAAGKKINESFKKNFLASVADKNSRFDLSRTTYINWKTPLSFECKKCGTIITRMPKALQDGAKCPVCYAGKSLGEVRISDFLKEMDISFEPEYYFSDLKDVSYLRYDFYIESRNLLIEYDGQQHYSDNAFGESSETRKKHDRMKDEYARSHNIKLLRIPYWEYRNIPSILKTALES